MEGHLPPYLRPLFSLRQESGGKDLVHTGVSELAQSWTSQESPLDSCSFLRWANPVRGQFRTADRVEPGLAKKETVSLISRKMFRRVILAVGLGQTNTGQWVKSSARVAAFECGGGSQFLLTVFAPCAMPHTAPLCATEPLIFPISRGAFCLRDSVPTLKVDATMRGTPE